MKPIKPVISCSIFFIAILANARRAPAQFTGPYSDSMGGGFNNPISAQMSTMLWNRIFYPKAFGNSGKSASTSSTRTSSSSTATPGPRTPASPGNRTDESALRFQPNGTRITTRKLADLLGNTAEERERYRKLMNAVLDGFDQKVKGAGLQNDIAIALSYFLAENARIYHGSSELSDQQYVDIRNVIAEALVSLDALDSITDRSKQEFYEGLVAYTGITQFGYEQSRQAGNDEMAKLYQKVAGQNLKTVTKMSPDDINFNPNGLSASGDESRASSSTNTDRTSPGPASGNPIDIYQLRHDYSENEVRANQIYRGKRFLFTGTVVEVSSVHYRTTGQDATRRYTYTNVGTNLKVANSAGTVIGWEVYCFFKDNNQLAQLRGQQRVSFEATVQGREDGSTSLILVDAVLR